MQHKRETKHNFFRLKPETPAIQNRITGAFRITARKLNMFCSTRYIHLFFSATFKASIREEVPVLLRIEEI